MPNKQNKYINVITRNKICIRLTQQYGVKIYVEISILTSLADGNLNCMTNISCSEYIIKTLDDGQ